MTVAASGLAAGASPTAQISEVSGHKHIAFGIPKGDTGSSGVCYGTTAPTDPAINVWINPNGSAADILKVRSGSGWESIPSVTGDDGRGISSVAKTGASGLVDTYTITYTDSTTSTFTVTNGQDGDDGVTFTPSVSSEGVISWSNDGGRTNPQPVNIKGPKGDDGDVSSVNGISPDANGNVTIPAATQSASGVMSAADKTKLDGLPASAAVPGSIAIIVDGDTAGTAIAPGQYAYIRNNTHGLAEGLYKNKSSSAFPTSGGTADSTVFEAVSGGGLNSAKTKYVDVTDIVLQDLTWDTSTYGMKYAEIDMPSGMTGTPLSITIIGLSGLRDTDNISAIFDLSANKISILSNTASFAGGAWTRISVRIAFIS